MITDSPKLVWTMKTNLSDEHLNEYADKEKEDWIRNYFYNDIEIISTNEEDIKILGDIIDLILEHTNPLEVFTELAQIIQDFYFFSHPKFISDEFQELILDIYQISIDLDTLKYILMLVSLIFETYYNAPQGDLNNEFYTIIIDTFTNFAANYDIMYYIFKAINKVIYFEEQFFWQIMNLNVIDYIYYVFKNTNHDGIIKESLRFLNFFNIIGHMDFISDKTNLLQNVLSLIIKKEINADIKKIAIDIAVMYLNLNDFSDLNKSQLFFSLEEKNKELCNIPFLGDFYLKMRQHKFISIEWLIESNFFGSLFEYIFEFDILHILSFDSIFNIILEIVHINIDINILNDLFLKLEQIHNQNFQIIERKLNLISLFISENPFFCLYVSEETIKEYINYLESTMKVEIMKSLLKIIDQISIDEIKMKKYEELKDVIQLNFDCTIFGEEREEILKIVEHLDYLLQCSSAN